MLASLILKAVLPIAVGPTIEISVFSHDVICIHNYSKILRRLDV